jgi:hypothetical protein
MNEPLKDVHIRIARRQRVYPFMELDTQQESNGRETFRDVEQALKTMSVDKEGTVLEIFRKEDASNN